MNEMSSYFPVKYEVILYFLLLFIVSRLRFKLSALDSL